jgi:hypothetical protein
MIWLLTRLVVVPVKTAAGGFKLGYWTGKVLGYRRILLVGTGVVVGVLFAPGPGAALRERLRASLGGGGAPAPTPPRPATPTVAVPSDRATTTPAPGGRFGTAPVAGTAATASTAPIAGTDAPPDPVDVIAASGGVVVTSTGTDEPVGEEVLLGTVESMAPTTDAEPLPAVPDADPALDEANPS